MGHFTKSAEGHFLYIFLMKAHQFFSIKKKEADCCLTWFQCNALQKFYLVENYIDH